MFKILSRSKISNARLTLLKTPHGIIRGPFFMPIATKGAIKNISVDELNTLNAQIILSNTYHLFVRPGQKLMKKYKGLHAFMNWHKPILTDSGGYQVFSLSRIRKLTSSGVHFNEAKSGNQFFLSPEKAINIQFIIGSDIMMVLDECPPYPCTKRYAQKSLQLTHNWAMRCKKQSEKIRKLKKSKHLLFGIVQGSNYKELRKKSVHDLMKINFDGYAIGGVAVGEPRAKTREILEWTMSELPENKPRYLMGLGKPQEIIYAVKQGIDMFDCVIPTREARHGRLYLWPFNLSLRAKRSNLNRLPRRYTPRNDDWYKTINITNAKFSKDLSPINNTNLKQYSKAYLHHLFKTNEPLGMRFATLNNLHFYLTLMDNIRKSIKKGVF